MQQSVVPAIRIKSFKAGAAFYKKLGFEEQWRHQFGPNFPIFASVRCDAMEIFLTEHTGDCAFGALVHFYVHDVDARHERFQAQGVAVAEPPSNSISPDMRHMIVVDPDGNRLSFITRQEKVA